MYRLARTILFRLDPELAHGLVFRGLASLGPLARWVAALACSKPDARLATPLAGLRLPGPVGLAAGLDKDGLLTALWPHLGFGHVEVGTVTARAQPGNPRPRLFRFPERLALVNRMGFNNRGSEALARRLSRQRGLIHRGGAPCGANIGKSKITPLADAARDYATSAERLRGLVDFLTINVSSPNTPGLRDLQDPGHLREIVAAVVDAAAGTPVFVKLAPDLSDDGLDRAVAVAAAAGASAIVATNTTIERYGLPDVGPGGLSGEPLRRRALEVIRRVARATELPVVGVGGLSSAPHVIDALVAGASAVQVFTGLVYEGPALAHRVHAELVAEIEREGLRDLAELVTARRAATP